MSCCCCSAVWAAVITVLIAAAVWFHKYMQGGKYTKTNRIDGKVVLITGANTGIGKETALELAKRGATVYMACRDMKKSEEARDEIVAQCGHERVYCRSLDLASMDSIHQFAAAFKKEVEKLDILINNAGIMHCPHMLTKDGFEMQLGVNHLGHFLLTHLLLDQVKKASPSRIINVSSLAHKFGSINKKDLLSEKSYNSYGAYSQSKLANVLFTKQLAKRLEGTGVTVNALHPGAVNTELTRHYNARKFLQPFFTYFMKTARNGAETTIYAALDPDLETITGAYFSDCAPATISTAAKNEATAKWLWERSEELTKLNA